MKISLAHSSLLLAPWWLFACQSSPGPLPDASWQPLEVVARFEAHYEGTIGAPAQPLIELPKESLVQSTQAEPGARQDLDDLALEEVQELPQWDLQCAVYRCDRRWIAALFGEDWEAGTQLQGWVVSAEEFGPWAERWVQTTDTEVLHAPRVLTFDVQPAQIAIVDQVAFLQHFLIQRSPGQTLVDPEVGVLEKGQALRLSMTAPPAGSDRGQLTLAILQNQLLTMQEVATRFPGGRKIEMQVPICLRESLHGEVPLAPGEVAILPPLLSSGDRWMLTVVQAKPVQP